MGLQLVRDEHLGLLCRPRLFAKQPPQQRARVPRLALAARSNISHRTLMAVGAVAEARLVVGAACRLVVDSSRHTQLVGLQKSSYSMVDRRVVHLPMVHQAYTKICPSINHLKEPPMPSHRAVGHIERPIIP